ncbi:MAG TPA: hypothetical protein VK468_09730, partial [Pyrinomonadaceae bacterium]|nr:hypothetical protein [Pyrinomonadaceae bacterium]
VSLAKLRSFSPTLAYGGHGEPVTDFDEIFHRYIRSIEDRQQRVISMISKQGSTAFDIAKELFAKSFDHDVHRFLAISEAVAHLDYAEGRGKIAVESNAGVEYYRGL